MIYKTKAFAALTRKGSLSDLDLINACIELDNGLFDADLGGNVYKKRVAIEGKGKRGGYRTIIGACLGERYFFLYAFAKSEKENISLNEKVALKQLARTFLSFDDKVLDSLVAAGQLVEVRE